MASNKTADNGPAYHHPNFQATDADLTIHVEASYAGPGRHIYRVHKHRLLPASPVFADIIALGSEHDPTKRDMHLRTVSVSPLRSASHGLSLCAANVTRRAPVRRRSRREPRSCARDLDIVTQVTAGHALPLVRDKALVSVDRSFGRCSEEGIPGVDYTNPRSILSGLAISTEQRIPSTVKRFSCNAKQS